jgi:hypothetical protein
MKSRTFNAQMALQSSSLKRIAMMLMILVFSGCSTRAKISGPPFGQSVSEDRLIRGIVSRLEKHGSFRFTFSGIHVVGDDPRVFLASFQPAEGQARTDLSLWWATRFAINQGLPDPGKRSSVWTMKARFQKGTLTNSHYLERTCRQPFQGFTTNLCTLYFGDYSGLWPTDDYKVTLRKTANEFISRNRKFKRVYRLVAITADGTLYTYRAEYQSAPSDPRIFMLEYTVGEDATLHRYGSGLSGGNPLETVITELFGFGENVSLPASPQKGER